MRINFSILWFDDSKDYLDSFPWKQLENEIDSWGFEPNIRTVTNPQEFSALSPYESFDIIIIDQNLGSSSQGESFIQTLRDNGIYTEVIFYSTNGAPQLWETVHQQQLEGVYVSDRESDELLRKISRVGKQSISKVLDLNNMRGIVVSGVGDLDLQLNEIVSKSMDKLLSPAQQKHVFGKFCDSLQEHLEEQLEGLEALRESLNTEEMLERCDSSKRWQSIRRVKKMLPDIFKVDGLGNYPDEILKPRNALAHGVPKLNANNQIVFTNKKSEYIFDDQESLRLRKGLLQYRKCFQDIATNLATHEKAQTAS